MQYCVVQVKRRDYHIRINLRICSVLNCKFGDNKYANGVYGSINPFDKSAHVSAAAAYKAIKSSGADVIVNPQYEIKATNFILFSTVEASVTGMKGTFKLK